MVRLHCILYVDDQEKSTAFYAELLQMRPSLHVPGMTEFLLHDGCVLGLMPVSGAERLLRMKSAGPHQALTFPRAEVYLIVNDPRAYHKRALELGAVEVSGFYERDWNHRAAYSLDPDGYVLAFAEEIEDASGNMDSRQP